MFTLLFPPALLQQEPYIKTIAHGEVVQEKDHLVKVKHTIFGYYADRCAPCRKSRRKPRTSSA